MNKNKFTKLSREELHTTYGGAWAALVASLPTILKFLNVAIVSIAGYKLISNSKGSVKYGDINASWESPEANGSQPKTITNYYTY